MLFVLDHYGPGHLVELVDIAVHQAMLEPFNQVKQFPNRYRHLVAAKGEEKIDEHAGLLVAAPEGAGNP